MPTSLFVCFFTDSIIVFHNGITSTVQITCWVLLAGKPWEKLGRSKVETSPISDFLKLVR